MHEQEGCPSEDVFVQFLSGRLAREDVMRLEHHAACCTSCLDLISGAVDLVPPPPAPVGRMEWDAQRPNDDDACATPPLRFGQFRVVDVLGRGGMGVVYRAVDERSGELVAVKTVRPSRRGALLSLHREIHALSQIRHPGVVRILAHGDQEGSNGSDMELGWYAMQLVEGATLAERLAARRRSKVRDPEADAAARAELLEILRRLCSTLALLHAAGFVHRDLSPRNVIIRTDGVPVLVDFGFALADAGLTREREVLQIDTLQAGTLLYMAPEQILGEPNDARSDLYSLGCILYEVLTGQPPFLADDPARIIDGHLSGAPRPPSQVSPAVPAALDRLALWLLAKRPQQRPAYADQVGRALARVRALGTGTTPAVTTPTPMPTTPGYLYRPGLVGREAPLAQLDQLLERCERGAGSRVFITGESGAGKTRLAAELAARAHRLGMEVVLGTSAGPSPGVGEDARTATAALQPLRPLLQAVAELCRRHGKHETLRLLGPRGQLLADYEPALQYVPGFGELPQLPALPGDGARFRLFDALEHTLVAFASRRPVVLILDDLQWADELTLSFVCEHLDADFFARHHVLLAATCRQEEEERRPELARTLSATGALRLSLAPLDAGAVARMIADMLGTERVPERLTGPVASHACGNPLFVVEYLRTALSEQRLVRSEAAWRLAPDPALGEEAPFAPVPVRDLVLRRLARLSPRAQSLIDLAAVLGGEFPLEQLLATARAAFPEPPPEQADRPLSADAPDPSMGALGELVVNQVLEAAESGHYRFVHDKLREIAYERIPEPLRRSHHAMAATALERRRTVEADFGRHYAALAAHYCAAHDQRRALAYLQRAASRALRAGTAREAQRLCSRALELDTAGRFPRRARLYRLRAEAHFALADLPACRADALAVLRETGGRAPASRGHWLRLLLAQGTLQLVRRLWPTPWPVRRGRARLSRAEGAVAAGLLASVSYFTGDWLPMTASLVLGANLAERAGAPAEIIGAFARLGYVTGLVRLSRLSTTFFERAMRLADARGDLPALALTLYLRAFHDLGQGRFAAAEATGAQAIRLLDQVGDVQAGDIARTIVGHAVFFQGRVEEAGDRYAALFESARRRANRQHMGWALALRARSLLTLGRAGEAVPLLEEARLLLAPLADDLSIFMCEGLLASAYLATDRGRDAEQVAAALEPRLRQAVLPLAPCVHGYVGAGAVALRCWDRAGAADAAWPRTARLAARGLSRFARMFPMARPAALAMRAAVSARDGGRLRAARLYRRALQEAGALGMSVETIQKYSP
jgi:eukaryotic-like serine/threonine-protein kinase